MKTKGTTLIELIMVMSLIALLAGIAIPSYIGITRGHKLNNAVRMITEAIAQCRGRAIALHRSAYVEFDDMSGSFRHKYVVNIRKWRWDDTNNRYDWFTEDELGEKYLEIVYSDWKMLPSTITFYSGPNNPMYHSPPLWIKCKPDGSMITDTGESGIFFFTVWEREKDKTVNIEVVGQTGKTKARYE